MGFFFRKSIGFGPFRINLSKSGIGVSTGIKGARIWTGPRGTFVQVGRDGLYYRQKIGVTDATRATGFASKSSATDWQSDLVELPHGKLLESITANETKGSPATIHIFYLAATVMSIMWISAYGANNLDAPSTVNLAMWVLLTVPPAIWILGVVLHYPARMKALPPLHPLYYRLDSERGSRLSNIDKALSALSRSQQITSVKQGQTPAYVAIQSPPFIVTNVNVWALTIANWRMFFMPDLAYIFADGTYSTIPYTDLTVSYKESRHTVYGGHPSDVTVVDRTWLHPRKDGYADLRYSYNPSIPIILYGFVDIKSKAGWNISLRVSNLQAAKDCFQYLSLVLPTSARYTYSGGQTRYSQQDSHKSDNQSSSHKQSSRPQRPPTTSQKSPYEVLGVREGASMEEITIAYRKQAQKNHPDRVADLAPEFQELAEQRMKEINAAYDQLRKRGR